MSDASEINAAAGGDALEILGRLGKVAVATGLYSEDRVQNAVRALQSALARPDRPERLVTVRAAADQLGSCTKTVHRLLDEGRLPRVYVTGSRKSLRIPSSSVEALVRGATPAEVQSATAPAEMHLVTQ